MLNVHSAAELIGVSESHLYDLIREQKIPVYRAGSAIRIEESELRAAMKAESLRRQSPNSKTEAEVIV